MTSLIFGHMLAVTSDDVGSAKVLAAGLVAFAAGFFLVTMGYNALVTKLAVSFFVGVGVAAIGFPILLSVIANTAPVSRLFVYLGVATAFAFLGTMVLPVSTDYFIRYHGTLTEGYGFVVLLVFWLPLTLLLSTTKSPTEKPEHSSLPSIGSTFNIAARTPSFWFMTTDFVLGVIQIKVLELIFVDYFRHVGYPAQDIAMAIALVGLVNIVSIIAWTIIGRNANPKNVLTVIYLLRSATLILVITVPLSVSGYFLFPALLGLFWFAALPFTEIPLIRLFGARYLAAFLALLILPYPLFS